MATATPAIARASASGDIEKASITRAGSATMTTAPMAVKWWDTMAPVSSAAAASVVRMSSRRTAILSASMPNSTPIAIETST
jgi:hypothetical protein